MGKKSPAPPPAPDYAALARQQGAENLAAAKQSAYMSNPNIYGPTGSQTVTWQRTPTVDTDAYNKAMEAYQQRLFSNPEMAGEAPSQEAFTTYIEQPTVTQRLTDTGQAAFEQQQAAEYWLNLAAKNAAYGIKDLSVAKPFDAGSLPNIDYTIGYSGPMERYLPGQETPGYTDISYAQQGIAGAPTAAFAPTGQYGMEALPGQVGPGQMAQANVAVQGAQLPVQAEAYGVAQGGPAAPQLQGADLSGVSQVSQMPFYAGMFGLAGAGPQGLNLQGLDLSGVGGVAGGPQQGQFGYAQQFVQGPELQREIDVSNIAQGPINAGMTAQTALLSRLSPQLQGERQQLQTQLINQGLRPGGEAYNAAMSAQMQKENDLLLQAAAQGISLDQAARQQQFAEQQSRAMFANQAALSGFGAGMEQAGLYNTGLGQNLQQSLATQAAQNQAQQQAFQQRLQAGEFGREAQLASFGTQQQAQQAANQAIGQNFDQALAAQQAQNVAQQQAYQQALGTGQFNREALMAQFGMGQQAQELQNQAIAQNYERQLAANQATNQALQQVFGQGVNVQELQNAAAGQNFQQQLAAQQANLARQAQQVGQSQEAAQFYNQAQAQAMQQELARQAAQNQAQAQLFGQTLTQQEARNAALNQRFSQDAQRAAFINAAQQQAFQQGIAQQQFRNTAIQQALAQQSAIRSMPINEISALLSGGQVAIPQFQGYQGVSVAPAPIFQAGQAAGDYAQRNYQNQVGAYNAGMGLLGSLAGAAGTAVSGPLGVAGLFTSDRRLKSNIVRVGTHPLGIGVYEYDINGERQRGVMADEVETVLPEAVVTRSDGYKMVNYGLL
jgi:hypothetical protein